MPTEEISRLLDKYKKAAIYHREGTECGDHRKANRAYEVMESTRLQLIGNGDSAIEQFATLMDCCDPWVRMWAATHSLGFAREKARQVIESLSQGKGILGFTAKTTLQEIEKGNL